MYLKSTKIELGNAYPGQTIIRLHELNKLYIVIGSTNYLGAEVPEDVQLLVDVENGNIVDGAKNTNVLLVTSTVSI